MKFLDYLFHGKELKAIGNYFKMLNGYSPTFTSFSGGVYEMDLTRTAMAHVEDGEKYYIRKEYTEVFRQSTEQLKPPPQQTAAL